MGTVLSTPGVTGTHFGSRTAWLDTDLVPYWSLSCCDGSNGHTWALVRGRHSSYFRRISRARGNVERPVRSRNTICILNGVVGCGFGVVFVALVLRWFPRTIRAFGSWTTFSVFSAGIRLYKSFARKPWLNGLPRASRLQAWACSGLHHLVCKSDFTTASLQN